MDGASRAADVKALAAELGLSVHRVDVRQLPSKYIGETEKNLSHLFAHAARRGWLLFFDEADALFGRRTEVKDAHDRYANIEIAHLLQRIEQSSAPVVVGTRRKAAIDPAFLRRLR